jgi:hypothetical protein
MQDEGAMMASFRAKRFPVIGILDDYIKDQLGDTKIIINGYSEERDSHGLVGPLLSSKRKILAVKYALI